LGRQTSTAPELTRRVQAPRRRSGRSPTAAAPSNFDAGWSRSARAHRPAVATCSALLNPAASECRDEALLPGALFGRSRYWQRSSCSNSDPAHPRRPSSAVVGEIRVDTQRPTPTSGRSTSVDPHPSRVSWHHARRRAASSSTRVTL
jgi:hypothetical protein